MVEETEMVQPTEVTLVPDRERNVLGVAGTGGLNES